MVIMSTKSLFFNLSKAKTISDINMFDAPIILPI